MHEDGMEPGAADHKKTSLLVYCLSMASVVMAALSSSRDGRKMIGGLLRLNQTPGGHELAVTPIASPPVPQGLPAPHPRFEDPQLLTEHTPGWHTPPHAVLAVPTWAPAMVAFGLVFLALGVVTRWPLSVIGAIIFVLAITKWMRELLHA